MNPFTRFFRHDDPPPEEPRTEPVPEPSPVRENKFSNAWKAKNEHRTQSPEAIRLAQKKSGRMPRELRDTIEGTVAPNAQTHTADLPTGALITILNEVEEHQSVGGRRIPPPFQAQILDELRSEYKNRMN